MASVRSWTPPREAGHPMSLPLLFFFLFVLLQLPSPMTIVVDATCARDFEIVVGVEMPSSSYVITDKSSRVECRIACWVDSACKTVTARPSNSSDLYDCLMTQHTRHAVSSYVQNADAVSFIRRDDGLKFVGSRFCGVSPTVGNAGLGSSYCHGLSSAYLADVKTVADLREIIKLLRDFDVNTPAVVGLSSFFQETIKYTRWTHPDGTVTYLYTMKSTVLQGINVTTTSSYVSEYFAFDLTPDVISLSPFTYYEQLPYICCSLS